MISISLDQLEGDAARRSFVLALHFSKAPFFVFIGKIGSNSKIWLIRIVLAYHLTPQGNNFS
jgi:hypothetical protein